MERSAQLIQNRIYVSLRVLPQDWIRSVTTPVPRHIGQIRAELAAAGAPIGPYDQMIAGHARSLGLIVVTNSVTEFTRVKGLRVENWVTA